MRFSRAVPLRRDRRELRRTLRIASRTTRVELRESMTGELRRLVAGQVPVVGVDAGPVDACGIVEFAGGTQLRLTMRDGGIAVRRLQRTAPRGGVYLGRVEPCFASSWYRLWFLPSSVTGPEEVFARVDRVAVPCVPGRGRRDVPRRRADGSQVT